MFRLLHKNYQKYKDKIKILPTIICAISFIILIFFLKDVRREMRRNHADYINGSHIFVDVVAYFTAAWIYILVAIIPICVLLYIADIQIKKLKSRKRWVNIFFIIIKFILVILIMMTIMGLWILAMWISNQLLM